VVVWRCAPFPLFAKSCVRLNENFTVSQDLVPVAGK
jgi:hypothetical protein